MSNNNHEKLKAECERKDKQIAELTAEIEKIKKFKDVFGLNNLIGQIEKFKMEEKLRLEKQEHDLDYSWAIKERDSLHTEVSKLIKQLKEAEAKIKDLEAALVK